MATGPSWFGLRMIVPNSHYTRAPRKPENWSQEESPAKEKVERKVAGSILEGTIAISNRVKVEYSCAYSCLMCYCESVICMEFLLQKYRPRANIKKTAKTISILRNERVFTSLPKIVYFKYFSRFSVTTTTTSASMASLKKIIVTLTKLKTRQMPKMHRSFDIC